MKNIYCILYLIFVFQIATAQEQTKQTTKGYTTTMDSLLLDLNKKDVTTDILYDRVIANANLIEFN